MFLNSLSPEGNPVCPACQKVCPMNDPDGTCHNDIVMAPAGLVLMHKECVSHHNNQVLARQAAAWN
jgi:hypothetical protein